MGKASVRACFIIWVILTVLAPACAAREMTLDYLCRYNCREKIDHLTGVLVVNPHRLVTGSYLGLSLVNADTMTSTGEPAPLFRLPGLNAREMYLKDNYIFVNLHGHGPSGTYGFAVVRIDGDTLTLVKTLVEAGVFYEKMCISGRYLYVAAHNKGIRVFDISNPEDPVLVGKLTGGFTEAFDIAVSGKTAYVADGAGGLKIVDIRRPTDPVLVGGEPAYVAVGTAQAVTTRGNLVYVALGSAGVGVYLHGWWPLKVVIPTGGLADNLCWLGKYLAVSTYFGVVVIDPEAPGLPRIVASEDSSQRGIDGVNLRLSYDLRALGSDKLVVANWDFMDVYQLRQTKKSSQPNIGASEQRVRFSPEGGRQVLTLTNTGGANLQITNVEVSSAVFSTDLTPRTLKPEQRVTFRISYDGTPGPVSGAVRIYSNDPDESPFAIQVFGETDYLDPGEPAADFTLPLLTRNPATGAFTEGSFRLSDYQGKVVYFTICASWCPACIPTIADVQNSVLREFARNPKVVALFFHEGGQQGETKQWMETMWSNMFLRSGVIWDETASVSRGSYYMPGTSIPFLRQFVIDQQGNVACADFGYDPAKISRTIRRLL